MTETEMMAKRIEELERKNEELSKMLKDVAKLAYFAYNDMKLSRQDGTESLVKMFISK